MTWIDLLPKINTFPGTSVNEPPTGLEYIPLHLRNVHSQKHSNALEGTIILYNSHSHTELSFKDYEEIDHKRKTGVSTFSQLWHIQQVQ